VERGGGFYHVLCEVIAEDSEAIGVGVEVVVLVECVEDGVLPFLIVNPSGIPELGGMDSGVVQEEAGHFERGEVVSLVVDVGPFSCPVHGAIFGDDDLNLFCALGWEELFDRVDGDVGLFCEVGVVVTVVGVSVFVVIDGVVADAESIDVFGGDWENNLPPIFVSAVGDDFDCGVDSFHCL